MEQQQALGALLALWLLLLVSVGKWAVFLTASSAVVQLGQQQHLHVLPWNAPPLARQNTAPHTVRHCHTA